MEKYEESIGNLTWDEIFYNMRGNDTGNETFSWTPPEIPKGYRAEQYIALVLGALATLANVVSILVLLRLGGSLSANLRLILSLCVSDVLVSVAVLFSITNSELPLMYLDGKNHFKTCLFLIFRALRITSHFISLFNLLGLAFDHYFAILRPLDYRRLMCRKRCNIMIIIFWVVSVLFGFSDFYIPSYMFSFCHNVDTSNYCIHAYCTAYDSEYLLFGMAILVFAVMFGIYCRIYSLLRKYQLFKGRHRKNMKKNRKGLITTFFIVGTFMLCWLPYCVFEVVINILMVTDVRKVIHYFNLVSKFDYYLYDLLLVNSLCDPIIYAVRMREFRTGYRNLVYRWTRCKKVDGTVCRDRFSEAEFASRELSCRFSNGTCTEIHAVSIMPLPSACDNVNNM